MTAPRAAADVKDRRAQAVACGQIDLLFQQLPAALVTSWSVATLLTVGLWNSVSNVDLLAWWFAALAICVLRFNLLWSYNRAEKPPADSPAWKQRFLLGVVAHGSLWGVAGFAFFLPDSFLLQTLLAFVLAGVSAGAVSSLAPLRGGAFFFLIPAIGPYALRVMVSGGIVHLVMGGMLILFVAVMLSISYRLHLILTRSLDLGFENLDLVDDLRKAHDQQEVAHQALAAEVDEKQRAQRALQESHIDLERRVEQRTRELAQIGDRLAMEKELFRITLASIGDGVITTDRDGRITYLNPSAERFTGWRSHEVEGKPLEAVFRSVPEKTFPGDGRGEESALPVKIAPGSQGPLLLEDRRGFTRDVHHSAAPIQDRVGETVGTVLTFRDISEERRLARQLSHQATHDALTGLVNRREFERRLARVIDASGGIEPHALIFLDLDQFKVVNDTCGHVAGDELLRQIAALMRNHIRARDTFARLGGDEFGVLLEHCPLSEAIRVAQNLRELAQDFRFGWQDKSFVIGVSLGVVEINGVWESAASVLRAADNACYMAKDRGRNRVYVYEPDDHLIARRFGEMQWMPRIQNALATGRLRLFRQPILPTRPELNGSEFGEILVRLLDEQGKLIMPGAFLPAAERYGQMNAIDRWVVGETIRTLCDMNGNDQRTTLSVNLSGQSFSDNDLLDFIIDRIKTSGVDPSRLCFEITETAAISDFTSALPFMANLRELGCRFALDDFGSGLSSFGYLKTLPVDYLKIDGRFVKEIVSDRIDEAMVEAIHRLSKVMGLKTIAEWVEDAATLTKLAAMEVDYVQGFHLARPNPI